MPDATETLHCCGEWLPPEVPLARRIHVRSQNSSICNLRRTPRGVQSLIHAGGVPLGQDDVRFELRGVRCELPTIQKLVLFPS